MFRFWDGTQWSTTLSPTPYAPPPGAGHPPITQAQPVKSTPAASKGRGGLWSWLVVGVVVAALVFGAFRLLSGSGLGPLTPGPPPSNATDEFCPQPQLDLSPSPRVQQPGRVQGGKLSYPILGDPWGPPEWEYRMPFGRDVTTQNVMVEPNYTELNSWVASILVGELVAGDGFFGPQQGAEIVGRCILGAFYGDNVVDSTTVADKATKVDGHDAWLLEMHLTFDIKGLKEKGETAIVVVVATGDTSSVFYASIPDSRPELLAEAREVQKQLRVEP